jgi:hypothetical protein
MAKANLTITVTSTYTYGYGSEDEHASYLMLTGVDPAPPTETVEFFAEGSRPFVEFDEDELEFAELKNEDGGDADAAGTIATLVAVAVTVGAIALRGRR